jgi:hypothetical protein
LIKNFRFEEQGVALSGAPETPEAVDWLYEQGVRSVLSLHAVSPEVEARMRERGMEWRPFPISDFAAGVPSGFREVLGLVGERGEAEPAALIH